MKQVPGHFLRQGIFILLGSAIYALAFNWCFAPNDIAFGGVTGLAQIVNYMIPVAPVGVLVIAFNIPLFLLGWKFLGGKMLVSSLLAMAASSVMIDVLAAWHTFQAMEDRLLACIFGGVVLGLGIGIIFLQEATTGGTEIIARLLKRKLRWLPMGKLLMATDLVVIMAVALVFGDGSSALYGIVALYLSSLVMDWVLYGLDTARVAYIVSDKPEEIAQVILQELERSVTYLQGEGGYSGQSKKVILCAFKQRQIVAIKETVRRVDPNAFLIVTAAHEVLGEGFGSYHNEI